ncbi:hypothetical protein OIU77_000540 [Salix suchowensis]|uniref:Uncharacterized protein n=1 Tax=Salix suchowensis TaxID=1278906 RepID=A0ABQ9B6I6_9ROSI|nr:hypothetical protein OIU77_000540 [Salix suchowensis]
MPGPGPHLMYAMTSGLALTTLTSGRFSPHHTLIYTVNAFFGPDIGSFSEWLGSILASGVPLSRRQCFLLVSAGSFSHFFLDHLFEENGQSTVYTWILSTGWWKNRAPVNPDAVFVVGFLCTCLIGGFIYLNRVRPLKSSRIQSYKSLKLVLIIASLYCVWCGSQIYMVNPRRPAVGEEADLGVLVFLATYFFLPHWFCIMSMNPKDHNLEQLPV